MAGRSSMPEAGTVEAPRGERGAALLVAMLAAVFLTILGLVLVEILKGGLSQAASTEASIQAEALAQRGLDDAVALIWNEVKSANGLTNANMHGRVDAVHSALGRKDDQGALLGQLHGLTVQGERGSYTIEIAEDVNNYTDFLNNRDLIPDYPYSRILTVKVTAKAGTLRKRTAVREADIFVTTINPVFKYPLSASESLTLNGAVYVVGDVLVRSGNMYVLDKAYFIGSPETLYRMDTALPTVKGFYRADEVIRMNTVENPGVPEPGDRFSVFEPFEDTELPVDADIPIDDFVNDRVLEMTARLDEPHGFFGTTVEEDRLEGYTVSGSVTDSTRYVNQWVRFSKDVDIKNSNGSPAHFAVDNGVLMMDADARVNLSNGSLYVRYAESQSIAAATFAGSLEVNPPHAVVVQGNAVIMGGFRFKGNMYVDGSLQIVGSVNLEGTIYVSGDVDMKEMRSLNSEEEGSGPSAPLILLSGGSIVFSDIRPANDDSIRVRAFLYSLEPMSLYGVQSKMIITGGIHGSSVTINAVREDSGNRSSNVHFTVKGNANDQFLLTPTDDQLVLPPDASNLQIYYDHRLFSDPPVGIPVTENLTMFVQSRV
ncbi:MAG TPA: hypothetical protein VIL22_02015 [Paenibacillaceae bacterium]